MKLEEAIHIAFNAPPEMLFYKANNGHFVAGTRISPRKLAGKQVWSADQLLNTFGITFRLEAVTKHYRCLKCGIELKRQDEEIPIHIC